MSGAKKAGIAALAVIGAAGIFYMGRNSARSEQPAQQKQEWLELGDGSYLKVDLKGEEGPAYIGPGGKIYVYDSMGRFFDHQTINREIDSLERGITLATISGNYAELERLKASEPDAYVMAAMTRIINKQGMSPLKLEYGKNGVAVSGDLVGMGRRVYEEIAFRKALYDDVQRQIRQREADAELDRQFSGYPAHTLTPEQREKLRPVFNVEGEDAVKARQDAALKARQEAAENEAKRQHLLGMPKRLIDKAKKEAEKRRN